MLRSDKMRTLFIGGPGRSGTSYVAARLGAHRDVCSLPDIELKLFSEKSGLLDLYHSLVEHYSPNRGTVAVDQFRRMALALLEGRYGQPAISAFVRADDWMELINGFLERFSVSGHPGLQTRSDFLSAARDFVQDLQSLVRQARDGERSPTMFVEKTPHSLLALMFLEDIAPGSSYMHVMRDPRSIAFSLRQMRWGPERLEACCSWVKSYCQAWARVTRVADRNGIKIQEIQIEAVAAAREASSLRVCSELGLAPDPKLFSTADATILNRWTSGCDASELRLIESKLAEQAAAAGYPAEVGDARDLSTGVV